MPILEESGYRVRADFGVAYSPERLYAANASFELSDIPKLVEGLDEESTLIAAQLYRQVIHEVVEVSHARVAEAAKMMENIFRYVNIALVNEMALAKECLRIDLWETIQASSTKPFGYKPFYPGPGIGGHCVPLDPHYFSYKARRGGYLPRFIELSSDVNEYMKFHAVGLLRRGLCETGKKPRGSRSRY